MSVEEFRAMNVEFSKALDMLSAVLRSDPAIGSTMPDVPKLMPELVSAAQTEIKQMGTHRYISIPAADKTEWIALDEHGKIPMIEGAVQAFIQDYNDKEISNMYVRMRRVRGVSHATAASLLQEEVNAIDDEKVKEFTRVSKSPPGANLRREGELACLEVIVGGFPKEITGRVVDAMDKLESRFLEKMIVNPGV